MAIMFLMFIYFLNSDWNPFCVAKGSKDYVFFLFHCLMRISGHILEVLGTSPEFWTNPDILEPVGTLVPLPPYYLVPSLSVHLHGVLLQNFPSAAEASLHKCCSQVSVFLSRCANINVLEF